MTDTNTRRTWDNYVLEGRVEYGGAARRNRGRYSGSKVHRVRSEYLVGFVDPTRPERPGTFGATFKRTGQPVLFSCRPLCGVTSGQHAARPIKGLDEKDVTCSKCGPQGQEVNS